MNVVYMAVVAVDGIMYYPKGTLLLSSVSLWKSEVQYNVKERYSGLFEEGTYEIVEFVSQ